MIVYRNESREVQPTTRLRALAGEMRALAGTPTAHDAIRDILIELGIVEAGIVDALNQACDEMSGMATALRAASHATARVFVGSWSGSPPDETCALAGAAADAIRGALTRVLPDSVSVGTPEGYSYYGLYPEQYVQAANDIVDALAPSDVVCIGLRGIGTSLSAAVAATLERRGVQGDSLTVRPRGHPFARELVLSSALRSALLSRRDSLFIIVDEGPGLSGSSFASAITALAQLGIPEDRVILMPSWQPDGDAFVSGTAADLWKRHRKFTASFEQQWLNTGRLASAFGAEACNVELQDWSAGAWRQGLLPDPAEWPAIQPQHERRKYVVSRAGSAPLLLKFTGLGQSGHDRFERMQLIADAGFTPAPVAFAHGFSATPCLRGIPTRRSDCTPDLLERMAQYLAFIARTFPSARPAQFDQLNEMIEINVREAVGDGAVRVFQKLRWAEMSGDVHPVALDARMLPHEWLRCGDTFIKTDVADHHNDHCFPGPQDIAWDLASTSIEFDLPQDAERALLQRFASLTHDRSIGPRLPFYRLAYLAYRAGYATLAADTLRGTDEAPRWQHELSRCRNLLNRELDANARAA